VAKQPWCAGLVRQESNLRRCASYSLVGRNTASQVHLSGVLILLLAHWCLQSFIKAAELMGVPREYMFNVADLDHIEDRLCVVNCLLWLKLLHESSNSDVTSKTTSPQRSPFAPPPLNSARSHRTLQPSASQQDFQQPQHSHRGSNGGGGGGATGVTKLMQECTVLLKAKMSYSSAPQQMTPRSSDAFSFDAVGPVLESVLGGLTQVCLCVRACASE
jgi:hypothetical protein